MAKSNNIPWGLHPLKPWVEKELLKRSREVGMNPDNANYAGPRTAWMRFFSNGISPRDSVNIDGDLVANHEGFIMGGVNGFNDSYGFNKENQIILGYDAVGLAHTIPSNMDSSYPHRPPPSIESIAVTLYGGQNSSFSGLCRKARVNWKCSSLDQLNYLEPYFLKPKVTAVVEWGWNNFEPSSLFNLEKKEELFDALMDGSVIMDWIEFSNGNYDAMIGFIFDYGFTLNALGGYDCFTEFVNANWLIEGQQYKSTSITYVTKDKETGKETETPMKTFVEFVDTDINNFSIKSSRNGIDLQLGYFGDVNGKTFVAKPNDSTNPNAIGHTDRKIWLRMDLVQEILNKYFSLVFKDVNGNAIGKGLVLDISKTILCGHPAIKSVIEDVLIPNKYAPRFTTVQSELIDRPDNKKAEKESTSFSASPYGVGASQRTTSAGTPAASTAQLTMLNTDSEYSKLFPEVINSIKSKNLTQEYDNLHKLINPSGRSFPMFERGDANDEQIKNALPGTWGYLSDIFISTTMIKDAMSHNDSAYRVLEYLLNRINEAFCGIVQLKIVPSQLTSGLSVIDTNYNPNAYVDSVSTLTRFTPGAVNSAFMTKAGLDVKISQGMANQMVAESSAGRQVGGVELRVGMKQANRFVGNDRLYDVGTVNQTAPSKSSTTSTTNVSDRAFSPSNFVFYQNGNENNKKYIIIEKDKMFMQSILSKDTSGKIIYINSPILPGTKFTMETMGIGGFTFLGQFTLDHVPESYAYKKCVWQIADIKQTIANGNWTTEITADCRPLSFIRK